MKAEHIKSYLSIAKETTAEEAYELFDADADYIAKNFPQITRHFQMILSRIGELEDFSQFVKKSFIELNGSLELFKKLVSTQRGGNNETKH